MYGNRQNFEDLMSMAKQNSEDARKRARNSNLLPDTLRPKRADPKQTKLKEGVAKFLAKRDEEDKKRKEEEKLKKERLLQLRNQDRKAANRVRKMLSMTKSANKSCVEDARECLNESIAAQGEIQPDEDDYGYTSGYADVMHKKMLEKYKAIPIKPVFTDSKTMPVPKHQSLQQNGTGWRNKSNKNNEGSSPEQEQYEEPVSSKKVAKPPPKHAPPDYKKLLELAEQKQLAPMVSAKPTMIEKKGDRREEFEYGRPMTAKEKAAFLAEKELRERALRQFEHGSASDKNNNSNASSAKSTSGSFKIPRAKGKEDANASSPPKKAKISSEPEQGRSASSASSASSMSHREEQNPKAIKSRNSSPASAPQNTQRPGPGKPNGLKPTSSALSSSGSASQSSQPSQARPPIANNERSSKQHYNGGNSSSSTSPPFSNHRKERDNSRPVEPPKPERKIPDKMELIKQKPRYLSAFEGGKEKEKKQQQMERQRPANSSQSMGQGRPSMDSREKPRKVPNEGERRPIRRDNSPPPMRRDAAPGPRRDMPPPPRRDGMGRPPPPRMRDEPPRMKPKPSKGRAIIDSDEEYDSEMDDFIDDSEVDMSHISDEISRIFKYDRRRFDDEESDDECMESSVAQQLREEQHSLRIGIKEDLEDMAREEEEKKRSKMLKMKKRR